MISWFDDMSDRELLNLIPFFEALANIDDVYMFLGTGDLQQADTSLNQLTNHADATINIADVTAGPLSLHADTSTEQLIYSANMTADSVTDYADTTPDSPMSACDSDGGVDNDMSLDEDTVELELS